jgi:hypothetical protein
LQPNADHHFGGDGKQQQAPGDAKGRQRDAELSQQPVADQGNADQDRARDQEARSAICRRNGADRFVVMPRNVGTRPIGSTTTKSVTSADIKNSSGMSASPNFRRPRVAAPTLG